jgi:enoyl-CoA hydratase/carnithine racemase
MSSIPEKIALPKSYTDLPFTEILLTHIPADSPTPTPTILVTLHRPGRHNAFTDTMMNELVHAFALIDVDPRVKCAIVTGHGRIFCAGADLASSFKGGEEPVREHRDGGGRVALAIHRCRKPVIGALQGSAVGIGITMTLPMSIRIAYEGAKIGFVFARRGIIMEACSSFYLPRLIGYVEVMLIMPINTNTDQLPGCPKLSILRRREALTQHHIHCSTRCSLRHCHRLNKCCRVPSSWRMRL